MPKPQDIIDIAKGKQKHLEGEYAGNVKGYSVGLLKSIAQALLDRDAALKVAVEALEFAEKSCLCERFEAKKGFDYGETHPVLGKAGTGQRWLTPSCSIKDALSRIRSLIPQ